MQVETILALIGSGGIVGILTVLLQHRQKMTELGLQKMKTEETIKRIIKKEIPLEYHTVFTTIDEIEHFFMRSFELEDEGRTIVVREKCVTKLRTWRKVLKKYAVETQKCIDNCELIKDKACNKSSNAVKQMLIEGLDLCSTEWDRPSKMDVYGKVFYDAKSYETMKIFNPIFDEWHGSREEVVRQASHEIPASNMNISCHGDWWDILTVYQYALMQMKYDALNAMKTLNGELTGQVIFGVVIGDIH